MPASYEAGLRMVEHYLGRASATKQSRGVFPHLTGAPSLSAGRVVRNRAGTITGTAAQSSSSVTSHGTRPGGSLSIEAIPEDLLLPLMAFFHNVAYTEVTPVSSNREVGTFKFGMIDAKPDHSGAVVGAYASDAATYKELVAMSDAYTIALELLYGHGNLGDVDNGLLIDNFIANRLTFEVQRGVDQILTAAIEGFGRAGDEEFDVVEAAWGPGVNGDLSSQSVLTPDTLSLVTLEVNDVTKATVYDDWFDSLSIVLESGISGRDALGHDEWNALATEARPSARVTARFAHVASDFLTALKSGQKIELTAKFSNGANEYLQFKFPHLKVAESFDPSIGDAGSDVTIEVPMVALVDPSVALPLVEVELSTAFDVRCNSFFNAAALVETES